MANSAGQLFSFKNSCRLQPETTLTTWVVRVNQVINVWGHEKHTAISWKVLQIWMTALSGFMNTSDLFYITCRDLIQDSVKVLTAAAAFPAQQELYYWRKSGFFFFVLFGTTHLNVTDKVKIDIQLTLFLLTVDAWWGRKNASTMVTELNLGGKVPDLVSVDDLSILPFTQPFLSYLSQWRIDRKSVV